MSNWLYLDYLFSSVAGWSLFVGLLATVLRLDEQRARRFGYGTLFVSSFFGFLWLPLVPHTAFFPLVFGALLGIPLGAFWAQKTPQAGR